jgi:hypothetical protein
VPTNISTLNSCAGFYSTVPIPLNLKMGGENVIRFGASGTEGFKVLLDGIEIFDDEV